jgi:hypothetical protein
MSSKNFKKAIFTGLSLLGMWGLFSGCDNNKSDIMNKDSKIISTHQFNKKPSKPSVDFIVAEPEITGISTKFRAQFKDVGMDAGIMLIELYQDGKKIEKKEFGIESGQTYDHKTIEKIIKRNYSITHKYYAIAYDNNLNSIKSKEIKVEFKGKSYDVHPEFINFHLQDRKEISILAKDSGDMKGLVELLLYNNDVLIDRKKCKGDVCSGDFPIIKYKLEENNILYAIAVDRSYNKTKSNAIKIVYK